MRKTLRYATVGVMVTLGLAGVGPTASADQSEPLTIVLQVRDTAYIPDDVLIGAQAHVTAHFRQAGVKTVWRAFSSSSTDTDGSREPRITVAILSHDQAERLQSGLSRDALGLAFNSSPTTRANVAYVFYERVRPLTGANGVTLAPVLGAAMAHEIGHLLLDNAHSRNGLMRADWTKADLQRVQRSELFFTAEQGERIRRRTGRVSAQTPVVFGFLEGETHAYVRRAVEGAAARLGRPGCQAVFTDFSDASGRPLSTRLAASGRSPVEVFLRLRFFEDRDAPQCVGGATLAFTQVGSQVVRVCGRHFKDRFLGNRTTTEFIMIHEFLHTLGLGENPPTSQAITEQVKFRCGL